jgi:hypothetical protein
METTERLGIPLLVAGQLQKEVWLNEGLSLIDLLIGGRMDSSLSVTPPADPSKGVFYRVPVGGEDSWSGQDGKLAAMTVAGWRFVDPFDGLVLTDAGDGTAWTYRDESWSNGFVDALSYRVDGVAVVGAQQAAIAAPTGGSSVDTEARTAVGAILVALRAHGLIASA